MVFEFQNRQIWPFPIFSFFYFFPGTIGLGKYFSLQNVNNVCLEIL